MSSKKGSWVTQIQRHHLHNSQSDRLLTQPVLFSCMLLLARTVYTRQLSFVFLAWNLFLAYLPYFISRCLYYSPRWTAHKLAFGFLFLLWLAWIPNSFYILTDLFHLGDESAERLVPLWFDLALILSFVWNGLLLGGISVRLMEKIMERHGYGRQDLLFVYPVMWMNALGIYIGRYLRFNSWDLITNPFQLIYDIGSMIMHPLSYRNAWGMIFCFSTLLTLMYLTIKRLNKTLD